MGSTTWKNISACLAQLHEIVFRSESSPSRGAANWYAMFMYMAEQCKRVDERDRERATAMNRNVEEICAHPSAMQIIREVFLSLTLTESSRRTWSVKNFEPGERSQRQIDYVVALGDDERRQVLIALLKFLFCMSNTNTARKEFFQNGFLIPLYSIALAPLCMCFQQNVNQTTRGVKHLSSCQKNCAETLSFIVQDESGENTNVGVVVQIERVVEPSGIDIEAVRVLHIELSHPQQARLGTRLVPELGLDLVPHLRELSVGLELVGDEGEHLFVGHAQRQIRSLTILEAEHLVAHDLPAAGPLPQRCGMHGGQPELLAPDGIHLLAHDVGDLLVHLQAEWQKGVVPGVQLADETGPDQKLVTNRLRIKLGP